MCVCVCVYAHKLWGNAEKRRHPMVGGKDTAEVSRALDLCAKLLQSSLTLCNPMDYSPLGSSVHGDSPGKNTGVGSMPSSRGSSQPRDRTQVSHNAGGFFTKVPHAKEQLSPVP